MSYILQNGIYYCFIDEKNAICKTQDIALATKFQDSSKAFERIRKATKKLKGFQVVDLKTNTVMKELVKVKRKQFTNNERIAIYNKNKSRCAICGDYVPFDLFTVDHIVPIAKGGDNSFSNLQCTCKVCNLIKQDILPEDLMKKLTKIILYQMNRKYDYSFWKKLSYIKNKKIRKKIKMIIHKIINR
jgi:5-methylcytosine-specific restriction endonuclease McrA